MKKTKIIYWVVTGLFAGFMFSTAIPNIMVDENSLKMIHNDLGFPEYFIPMIGWAKVLGVIGILVPGFPRVKEWAYAGLFFDLAGAGYASIAVAGFYPQHLIMLIFFGALFASYFLYHKLMKELNHPAVR